MCRSYVRPAGRHKRQLEAGIAAGPLSIATFAVAGYRRAGYDPRRHPVSALALGPGGWVQNANFVAGGTLYLAAAAGLARAHKRAVGCRLTPLLIAAAGAGLIGAAVFPTDPVSGYPPGTPDAPVVTRTGQLHNLAALPVFAGISAAALLSAASFAQAGERGWASYSAGSGLTMLIGSFVSGAGFSQSPGLVNSAGLIQRASITAGFAWVTALSTRGRRTRA